MDLEKAYKILGLDSSSSKEEVNKTFRKLAARYHPDVNKEKDAEAKFKDINAAYQLVNNPPPEQNNFQSHSVHNYSVNFGKGFGKNVHKQSISSPLELFVTLTFAESVLGCVKEFDAEKYIPCEECDGEGGKTSDTVCDVCKGRGRKIFQEHGNTFIMECDDCNGNGRKITKCKVCDGEGSKLQKKKFSVPINGVTENQIVRLRGGGHFQIHPIFGHTTGDAFIRVQISSHSEMRIKGDDVVSTLKLSLLEALEGVQRKVETVKGNLTIKIPAGSRNREKIEVKGYGVVTDHKVGSHFFELDVQYPNKDNLIKFLKENKE